VLPDLPGADDPDGLPVLRYHERGPPAGRRVRPLLQRAPDLESEEADTYTAGVVLTSHFENPWLSGLSATLDWYSVDIQNAIQQYSTDYAPTCATACCDYSGGRPKGDASCLNGSKRGTGAPTISIEYENRPRSRLYMTGLNWIVGSGA
jgi:hypothetical protein